MDVNNGKAAAAFISFLQTDARSYSYLRATRDPRGRAGTYPARVATAARANATAASVDGSLAKTPKSMCPSRREAASALGTPTARPANVRTSVSRKTTHRIAPFEAKGARPPSIETESRKVGWRRDTSHGSFPEMKLIVDDLLETTRNFPRMG